MPLAKRSISPQNVSQHRLPPNVHREELECVANGTLANLVRQLSSLSRHAEDLFGELYHEAIKLDHKTNTLAARVDRLTHKVTQLDSNEEEVTLQDLHLRKPFKSSSLIDQHSLDRQTLSTAMNECYTYCDRPPELNKLNPYRDDKKVALRYYTDPSYFFDLWKQEMLKDVADGMGKRPKHAKNRSPIENQGRKKRMRNNQTNDWRHQQQKHLRVGEMIDLPAEYQAPELLRNQQREQQSRPPPGMIHPESNGYPSNGHHRAAPIGNPNQAIYDQHQQHPRVTLQSANYHQYQPGRPITSQYMPAEYSLNLPPLLEEWLPPPDFSVNIHPPPPQQKGIKFSEHEHIIENEDLPLPPPPSMPDEHLCHQTAVMSIAVDNKMPSPPIQSSNNVPMPPPPPPINNGVVGGSFGTNSERQQRSSPPTKLIEPAQERSNFLLEIQKGIKLNKVQRQEQREEERAATQGNDVAAILRRRMEHVYGGSDSNSDADEEYNDEEWDD